MLITPTGRHGIFADRDNPQLISPKRARAALPILIRYAQRKDTITFRELADAIAAPDMINRTMRPNTGLYQYGTGKVIKRSQLAACGHPNYYDNCCLTRWRTQ